MNYLDEAVTKSLDEFMEYYKVVDTEEIYSNGTEFVPIFRVKQWEEYNNKDKEIERLNNIINELERLVEDYAWNSYYFKCGNRYLKSEILNDIREIIELKGSDKEC